MAGRKVIFRAKNSVFVLGFFTFTKPNRLSMKNKITIQLSELIEAGILSPDKAQEIRLFYQKEEDQSQNRLFAIFGIFGAILVGLGIILILAHNWDDLSNSAKTIISFLPLLAGQGFCAYSLLKKPDSQAWKESAAAFLFFSVGACMSLISQIYNIPGNISSFTLTWMLLCLPLVYIMRSSIVSLLYIAGITFYACETGYWMYPKSTPYIYWLLLSLIIPHYFELCKNRPHSNFMVFHNWFVPLSAIISLGTLATISGEFMFVAYISLFGLLYSIGYLPFFANKRRISKAYSILGSAGMTGLFLFLSFKWFWEELQTANIVFSTPDFFAAAILSLAAAALLVWKINSSPVRNIMPAEVAFLIFILIFIIGFYSPVAAVVLINLLVFTIGVLTIRQGAFEGHLGILNYGLLIITTLIICRFFDTNISFVARGILFLLIGFGFFFVNYWMLKRKKSLRLEN